MTRTPREVAARWRSDRIRGRRDQRLLNAVEAHRQRTAQRQGNGAPDAPPGPRADRRGYLTHPHD